MHRMAAVRDAQYRYYPSQERLVDVSNYLINPDYASPSPDNVRGQRRAMPRNPGSQRGPSGATAAGDFDLRNANWSTQLLSASDVLGLRLPVIVKVVGGYDGGGNGLRLNSEQIVQVSGWTKQMRIAAAVDADRTFTFPADQRLRLRVLPDSQNPDGTTQSPSEVLDKLPLPVDVEVIDDVTSNNSSSSSTQQFPETRMTLRRGIEEHRFLVCNRIVNGWLQQTVTLVPEQLPVQFRLATGTKHTTPEEWTDIRGMYCRAARHIKLHLIEGYNGIIYDDWMTQEETPLASTQSHSSRTDRERNDDDDDDDDVDYSDSESTTKRTRCQLLWQQTALSQGSLPSLPTAVVLESTQLTTERTRSGSSSPFPSPRGLSTESLLLQPSKSTESLLPLRYVDSGSAEALATGNASSNRKSNVPSRLRRRKGGKQAAADASGAESIDRRGGTTRKHSDSGLLKSQVKVSILNSSKFSNNETPANNRDAAKTPSGANAADLQPRSRENFPVKSVAAKSKSDAKTKHHIAYSDVITEAKAIDKQQTSDCDTISTSPVTESDRCAAFYLNHSAETHDVFSNHRRPYLASRDHIRTPIHWSSDLGIDGEASLEPDPEVGRRKLNQPRKPTAAAAAAASRRSHSLGFTNFDANPLQPWTSCQSFVSSGHRLSIDYGSGSPAPLVWPSRSPRMQTNGLVKTRLDDLSNGGSDVIDDGYGTESVCMTPSSNTLTMTCRKRESVFYI